MELSVSNSIVDDMSQYFNRQDDHNTIRDSIKARYGIGIKPIEDPNQAGSGSNSFKTSETYTKENFRIQVDAGIVEGLSMGFGNKIANALGTLFTETGQKMSLSHDPDADVEDAEKLFFDSRDAGGYKSKVVECDRKSVTFGSAALLIEYVKDGLKYNVLNPADVHAVFGTTIVDDGVTRLVDHSDIEDASLVILRLNQIDGVNWNYLAIYGRGEYKNGRYVYYQSSEMSHIPEVGSADAIDYEIDGEIANPLSFIANAKPDEYIPEYPIAIYHSGTTDINAVMPITTSLYADSLEVDTAGSHLLSTSQKAASGTIVIERESEGAGKPLPRTLHGGIALESGQKAYTLDHKSASSKDAMEVLNDLMVHIGGGYGVPDYMVVSEDHALEASSGVALQVKTRPLKKEREKRIELNMPTVQKQFEIEKALIWQFSKEPDQLKDFLFECELEWEPGELRLPENQKEKAEKIIALMDKGIMDTIAGIREYYSYPTDTEAIEHYNKMKDRQTEFPSLAAEPKKEIGLLRNRNGSGR